MWIASNIRCTYSGTLRCVFASVVAVEKQCGSQQSSKCTYIVTMRRVRSTVFAVESQYICILSVFVAFGVQHVKRMHHIVICRLSGSKISLRIILCASYDYHNHSDYFIELHGLVGVCNGEAVVF